MRVRTARSSPCTTPLTTTKTVIPMNRVCQSADVTQLPVKPPKMAAIWSGLAPPKSPEALSKM